MRATQAPDESRNRGVWLYAVPHEIGVGQHRFVPAVQATHDNCGIARLGAVLPRGLPRGSGGFRLCGRRYAICPAGTPLDHGRHINMDGDGIESAGRRGSLQDQADSPSHRFKSRPLNANAKSALIWTGCGDR